MRFEGGRFTGDARKGDWRPPSPWRPCWRPVAPQASAAQPAAGHDDRSALQTATDRSALLAVLSSCAHSGALHVDDVSAAWAQMACESPGPPPGTTSPVRRTIYAGLWRGHQDDDPEVLVDDGGHPGRAWVTFLRGKSPTSAEHVRLALLAQIKARWPDAQLIPIMPNGGLLPGAAGLEWDRHGRRSRPGCGLCEGGAVIRKGVEKRPSDRPSHKYHGSCLPAGLGNSRMAREAPPPRGRPGAGP